MLLSIELLIKYPKLSLLGQIFIKTRSLDENNTHETKKNEVPNKFSHTKLMLIFFMKSCLDEIKNFKSLEVIPILLIL